MRRRGVPGEAVMVGGLGRRCVWWADVKWLRVFGWDTMQCSARHVVCVECVCGNGAKELFGMAKEV